MKRPPRCGISIDPGCTANCVFCGLAPHKSAGEIKKQIKWIARDLAVFKRKGYKRVEIFGNDPIEYGRLISLIKYVKDMGFNDILLSTHGRRLADKVLTKKLIKAGVTSFRIPLYGSAARIHDSITRVKGSFSDVVKGIQELKEGDPNMKLISHTLVLQQNKEDVLHILKLALKLKIDHFTICGTCVANDDYSYYVPYKDLGNYLKEVSDYISITKIRNVSFYDMPYCILGARDNLIAVTMPPKMGMYGEYYKFNSRNLPPDRLRTKVEICNICEVSDECQGFYLNDVRIYGTGDLKPITCHTKKDSHSVA